MNEWMRLGAESSPAIWVGRGSWMAQGCAIRCVRMAASLLNGGRHFHGRLARLAISGASSSANSRAKQCYVMSRSGSAYWQAGREESMQWRRLVVAATADTTAERRMVGWDSRMATRAQAVAV